MNYSSKNESKLNFISIFQERLFGKSQVPELQGNDQCWNGEDSGQYDSDIVQDGLAHLLKNPEIQISSPLIEPAMLKIQINKLTTITAQLKEAHKGNNVQWWDEVSYLFIIFLYFRKLRDIWFLISWKIHRRAEVILFCRKFPQSMIYKKCIEFLKKVERSKAPLLNNNWYI